jgi:hypothetical protein
MKARVLAAKVESGHSPVDREPTITTRTLSLAAPQHEVFRWDVPGVNLPRAFDIGETVFYGL